MFRSTIVDAANDYARSLGLARLPSISKMLALKMGVSREQGLTISGGSTPTFRSQPSPSRTEGTKFKRSGNSLASKIATEADFGMGKFRRTSPR